MGYHICCLTIVYITTKLIFTKIIYEYAVVYDTLVVSILQYDTVSLNGLFLLIILFIVD